MAKRSNYIKMVSPKGVFVFPKLNEPDTKFNAAGEYSVKLSLRAEDPATQAFIAKLAPIHENSIKAAEVAFKALKPEARKKLGSVSVNDFFVTKLDENEQPTGLVEFNFKMAAKKADGSPRRPQILDASLNLLKTPPQIWGGTAGRVAFAVNEDGYFIPGSGAAGIKFYLDSVQIIDLRTGGGVPSGFAKEDGFDGSLIEASEDQSTSATDDSADF